MYELLSRFAQTGGLILFCLAFALVLIYALNPRRQKEFDHASRIPIDEKDVD